MTHAPATLGAPAGVRRALGAAALLACAAALGGALAVVAGRAPVGWTAVAGGVGAVAVVALAVGRYDAAVALGLLLFGVVRIEPAPTDGVFAVVIGFAFATGRLTLARVPLSMTLLLAGFVVLNLLSAAEAIDLGVAARFAAITLYLVVFAVWLTGYLDSERRARLVVRAYVWPAVAFAVLSSLALFVEFPGSGALLRYDGTRATGLFEDPNVFGPFLVPAALIVLEEVLQPRLLRSSNRLKTLAFLALTAGVLFSYSRAAWVNMAVGVVVLVPLIAIRRGGTRRALRVLAVLVLAGVTATAVVAATGSLDFLQERAQLQSYDTQRFDAQRTGVELASDNPIGIGPGQFEAKVPISAHSTYVRALAEQGYVGFALVAGLVFGTLAIALRGALRGRTAHGVGSAALLAAWVGISINSLVVDTLHWRHLWLVAALIWIASQVEARSPGTPVRPR